MGRRPGGGEAQASPPTTARKPRKPRKPRVAPADLPPAERRRAASEAALRLLDRRDRSEAEIRIALRRKGYDPETIVTVVDRLRETRLVDDRRYAEGFAEVSAQRRGYAVSAVRSKLRGRGIDAETAAAAAAAPPEEEEARGRAVAARRARALSSYPPEVRYRRLLGFLARRGYPGELASRLARELAGPGEDEPTS